MYASKQQAFTPFVYQARVLLAALDYNFHCDRAKKTKADGTQMYHRVYKKHAKHNGVYALRTPKSYNYIGELQTSVDQNSSPVLPYEGVTITLLLPNRLVCQQVEISAADRLFISCGSPT
ncbi:hypothetical protein AALO_G00047600 [Alosa alosa]|uniref:Uncharacterized protein n=1 Tax=Alosa alosa TaxID=278164 RepID=A0AAV6H2X2_9TELE|nr:hypothetical protein AALO_G00047600 [Alosa alosa]